MVLGSWILSSFWSYGFCRPFGPWVLWGLSSFLSLGPGFCCPFGPWVLDFVVLLVLGSWSLLSFWSLGPGFCRPFGPMDFVVLLVLWSLGPMGFVVLMVLQMGSCRCVECSVLREGRKEGRKGGKRRKKEEGRCLYIDFYHKMHVIACFGRPYFGRPGVPTTLNPTSLFLHRFDKGFRVCLANKGTILLCDRFCCGNGLLPSFFETERNRCIQIGSLLTLCKYREWGGTTFDGIVCVMKYHSRQINVRRVLCCTVHSCSRSSR